MARRITRRKRRRPTAGGVRGRPHAEGHPLIRDALLESGGRQTWTA